MIKVHYRNTRHTEPGMQKFAAIAAQRKRIRNPAAGTFVIDPGKPYICMKL
jgi:hypothetical protein